MVMPVVGSVVIPAHNEAGRIERCLAALLEGLPDGVDVVVAANGCHDDTAERARRAAEVAGRPVKVLDLPQPGKVGAIRAAEAVTALPRLYLDADCVCSGATAAALLEAVGGAGRPTDVDVAVPRRVLDLSACTWGARQYFHAWEALPWVGTQLAGRGAYALGEAARCTFGEFPDIVADDRFATTRVSPERATIIDRPVVVPPARSLRELVVVRTRVYAGNTALAGAAGAPAHDRGRLARLAGVSRRAVDPRTWPGLAVFASVTVVAKLRARRNGSGAVWGLRHGTAA